MKNIIFNMKKCIILILCVTLMFTCFVACENKKDETEETKEFGLTEHTFTEHILVEETITEHILYENEED